MKFPTRYSEKKTVFSNPGQRFKTEYQLVMDDKGREELVPCGQTDVQAFISSHYDSVDMNIVLARLANGDTSVLEKVEGFYADVSDIPVRLSDIMNMNRKGKEIFDQLPIEYKQIYGNDYQAFVFDPSKLVDYMKEKESKYEENMESEVKSDDDAQL